MKKLVKDLLTEELIKVFKTNEQLQNDVLDDYEDTQMYSVEEWLDCFRKSLSDWCISFTESNYIEIRDNYLFLKGVLKAQERYGLLDDNYTSIIKDLIEEYDNYEDIEEKVESIEVAVLKAFDGLTDTPSYEDLEDYFVSFYSDARLDENYYVDNDYVLYQDIAYTKSYK